MNDTEKLIRSIKRWCRGPMLMNEEEQAHYRERWIAIEDTRDLEAALKLKAELEMRLHSHLGEAPDFEQVWRHVAQLIYSHTDLYGLPCGQDINDVIIADGQFDGELH